ncbi:MAG TPA: ABC transporter ATP-binding protein [Candidatus Binatia bacterium]|jgi:ATP-binding cassette subfamily B protein|nr:ABC transporter ATP-binding protein [Candidatus Binatia bacterium]
MSRLWGYVARYRLRLAGGIACLIGATSLTMSVPLLFKRVVNEIGAGQGMAGVAPILGLIALIAVAQGVVRTFSRFMIFNVGRDIEYDLRNDLFAHLERLPVAFYQERRTGDLMSRLVNDVTAVRMLLGPGILNFINTPIYYAYGLSIMLSIDARLTVGALAGYPLALYVVKRTSAMLMERSTHVQEGLAELSSRVQENLSGIHVVKAYASEDHEIRDFAALNATFREASLRLARVRGFVGPVMSVVGGIGTLVVLWYGGWHVIQGRLSVGDMVAFIGYLNLLAWPTMALGWMLSVLQRGRASMNRLNELFAIEPAITSPHDATAPATCRGEIELRGVTFRHGGPLGTAAALENVDLVIPAGRTVAIVGRTGSGKTSLVHLLPRLFDVDAGTVLLDGRDVRTLPLGWLRKNVGLVPQDPFLFSRTIRENVGFAATPNGVDPVGWAVTAAGLDRDLADMPRGLETVVGERGITLSGGQKQRVTLARVLASAPRVLILDDALSSVDASTEREILDRLRDFFDQRTTILVAHRITTVKEADLIVVLEQGRVAEVGDHGTLLAKGGLYADLFREQSLEVELEAV